MGSLRKDAAAQTPCVRAPYESYRAPTPLWTERDSRSTKRTVSTIWGINRASRHLSLQFTVLLEKPIVAYTTVS